MATFPSSQAYSTIFLECSETPCAPSCQFLQGNASFLGGSRTARQLSVVSVKLRTIACSILCNKVKCKNNADLQEILLCWTPQIRLALYNNIENRLQNRSCARERIFLIVGKFFKIFHRRSSTRPFASRLNRINRFEGLLALLVTNHPFASTSACVGAFGRCKEPCQPHMCRANNSLLHQLRQRVIAGIGVLRLSQTFLNRLCSHLRFHKAARFPIRICVEADFCLTNSSAFFSKFLIAM